MSELNLIPYSLKIKRAKKQLYKNIALIATLILIIMFGGLYFPYVTSQNLKINEADLKKQIDAQSYILNERDNLNKLNANINDFISNVDILIKNKSYTYNLIKGLQNNMPKDVVFTTLSYSIGVLNINAVSKNYNSAAELVANLQSTEAYKNSMLLNVSQDGKNNGYIFSIKIDLKGGAL